LFAQAAILDGKYAQAFPDFGPERLGSPVAAFARVDDQPIEIRSQIYTPTAVAVFEQSLLATVPVTRGLVPEGRFVVNTTELGASAVKKMGDESKASAFVVDASRLARELIGTPTVSTIMLGALANASGCISIEALESAVKQRFHGDLGDVNAKMVRMGFKGVKQI
jgi:2-oxoacid:acceptor oxidoreductase gamma subunit (pyruvate/2-ketoisovalerate family)